MRALLCTDTSDLTSLAVQEVPDPSPGPGQVLVDVRAASVDFVDTLIATGVYQIPVPVPYVPGNNVAGVVAAVGPGCSRFAVGERVHGMAFIGAFAERVCVAEAQLRPTPAGLSPELACLTGSTYRTAYDALVSTARIEPGEDLVILGASGAVGSAAIGIGKSLGARVIACAAGAAKLEFCRDLGADELVDYSGGDLKRALKELCPKGAGVVLDMVGGPFSEPALRATGYGGRFVVVGFATGEIARVPLNLVLLKGSTVMGYEIGDFERHHSDEAEANRRALEALLTDGTLKPPVTGRYRLDQAAEAMRTVAGRAKLGLTVLDLT
ncbi:NADPH:quinone oxidoreductase family protein [Nonomuraea wenchangensis]|uniref:NADPH2:quinone reductase n=1 Tax=Nonomuraea wenchangensis TaxID=568860 RepID=A0A1I0L2U8_9ACTN|nr:NADPH:quinone oxidoreductase family protein [Nonomuraea wenchangensis]SEU33601.1 NADPH2:quinone reductase [Nonomuraea wenchangensis]